MSFSKRLGITPLSKPIQLESIDDDLKNGLWNICDIYILRKLDEPSSYSSTPWPYFSNSLFHHFFKKTLDSVPDTWYGVKYYIKNYFFKAQWYLAYDLIEQIYALIGDDELYGYFDKTLIKEQFNNILEREFAGYRFINEHLSPITNAAEISEIEDALLSGETYTSLKHCNIHLREAMQKLSDRLTPDYRNSIKESISAVESIAKVISNNANDSLGGALDKIKGKLKIHAAFERAFKQLYGYTSDAGGIRHALTDKDSSPDFEDAKFMLVSCSAFINYLVVKATKAGVTLE